MIKSLKKPGVSLEIFISNNVLLGVTNIALDITINILPIHECLLFFFSPCHVPMWHSLQFKFRKPSIFC